MRLPINRLESNWVLYTLKVTTEPVVSPTLNHNSELKWKEASVYVQRKWFIPDHPTCITGKTLLFGRHAGFCFCSITELDFDLKFSISIWFLHARTDQIEICIEKLARSPKKENQKCTRYLYTFPTKRWMSGFEQRLLYSHGSCRCHNLWHGEEGLFIRRWAWSCVLHSHCTKCFTCEVRHCLRSYFEPIA